MIYLVIELNQGWYMRISDALLYTIYKNNNKMTSYDLLNYIKQLEKYEMLEVNEDGISFTLTNKGSERLISIGLIKV